MDVVCQERHASRHGDGAPVGRYDVHHDPGVWLVLVGAVLLFAGTIWALTDYLIFRPGSGKEEIGGFSSRPAGG